MNNNFHEWFVGLATVGGFAYFMTGFMVSYIIWWWRCKRRHTSAKIPWRTVGIIIGVSIIVVTSVQSSEAYQTAEAVAQEQKECNIQFHNALIARGSITSENDALSQEQRTIVFNWFHDLIFPPPPYDKMSTDDPERQQFALNRTIYTEDLFHKSVAKQEVLQAERAKHPFPDPTCGR